MTQTFINNYLVSLIDDNLNAIVSSGGGDYDFVSPADKDSKSNKKLKTAAGGLFNAPSIIPVNNPGIRVYEYQTSAGDYPVGTIRDWKQYYVDLEKANDKRTIEFELEYTASKFYGVDHFDGAGVGQAVMNVAGDGDSRDLYDTYSGVSS
jgi:hypothetical protein